MHFTFTRSLICALILKMNSQPNNSKKLFIGIAYAFELKQWSQNTIKILLTKQERGEHIGENMWKYIIHTTLYYLDGKFM